MILTFKKTAKTLTLSMLFYFEKNDINFLTIVIKNDINLLKKCYNSTKAKNWHKDVNKMEYQELTDSMEWIDTAVELAKNGNIDRAIELFNEHLESFKQGVDVFAQKYGLQINDEITSLISKYEQFLSNPEQIETLPEERLNLIRVMNEWFEANKEKLIELTEELELKPFI